VGAGRAARGNILKTYRMRVGTEEVQAAVEEVGGAFSVRLPESVHHVDLAEVVPGQYSLIVDGQSHDLGAAVRAGQWALVLDGESYTVEVHGTTRSRPARRAPSRRSGDVPAPMPGLLVDVRVADGATVTAGQPLIIIEAMKMQMEIRAPHGGTVRRVHVAPGQEVAQGQVLVTLD
jgi:biotin carboxyl carrier protein